MKRSRGLRFNLNSMKQKILFLGAGGHCRAILGSIPRIKGYEAAGLIDPNGRSGGKVCGVPVIGTDADLPRLRKSGIKHCFIAVGSTGDPRLRIKLYDVVKKAGFLLPNLISPDATVASSVSFGEGNYVAPGVIINSGTQVKNNCIINTGAIVEHDCRIGDFVHISPASVLSGGVVIGDGSHVGTGSVIIQNLSIGERTVIGAGSVVTKNIGAGVIAYGNPCRERRKNG